LKEKSVETSFFKKKSAYAFCAVYSPLNFKDFSETQSILLLRGQYTTLLVFISDTQEGLGCCHTYHHIDPRLANNYSFVF
jgi:hypothetical protein